MSDSLLITTDAFGGTQAITWSFSHATPVYAEMEVYLLTASLTAWYTDAGGSDIQLGKLGFQFDFGGNQLLLSDSDAGGDYDSWFSFYDAAPVVAGTSEGWHTIRWSGTPDGGTLHLAADATDQTSTMPAYGIGNLTSARFGTAGVGVAGQTMYIGRCRVGTTLGGFDLLDYTPALDGDPGTFGFSVDGTIALSTAPTPPPSSGGGGGGGDPTTPVGLGGVRIAVAFDDPTLEPTPTWTYLTFYENLAAGYSIDRGRQYEFDKVDTGTATITINDVDGILDPTNTAGPLYGKIEPLLQVKIDLYNPVANAWDTRFRGFIEDYNYSIDPSQVVTRLQIECVDLFEILTAIEMQPDGSFGDVPPTEATGNIFFDNASAKDRIEQVLGNAGLPTEFYVVFDLNVDMLESTYSPSENVLQVVQDGADADLPTVSNVACGRDGRLFVHGRMAKFDPVTTAFGADWNYTHWKAGDETAVLASISDTAQLRTLAFNRGVAMIRNSCMCTPNGIEAADIAGQLATDVTSIGKYGYRSWSAENLLIDTGTTTGNTGLVETHQYAIFIKEQYKNPRNRISEITFRSMSPSDPRAAANWALLCGVDISDTIEVTETSPGSGGFTGDTWFVEGVHEEVQPLNSLYADVTLSLDLSPGDIFIGHGSGTGYDLDG